MAKILVGYGWSFGNLLEMVYSSNKQRIVHENRMGTKYCFKASRKLSYTNWGIGFVWLRYAKIFIGLSQKKRKEKEFIPFYTVVCGVCCVQLIKCNDALLDFPLG